MKLTQNIEKPDGEMLSVEFEAFPKMESDGIGWTEAWGIRQYDEGQTYASLERNGDPTWDKAKYSDEENKLIEEFSNGFGWGGLCERFCNEYKEGTE